MSTRIPRKVVEAAVPARAASHLDSLDPLDPVVPLDPLDPPQRLDDPSRRAGVDAPRLRVDALWRQPAAPPPPPAAPPYIEARELWIGAYFPNLALEALGSTSRLKPLAAAELQGRAQCIVAANEEAARAGVRGGMSVSAALALVPQLMVESRDPRRERALLERLATLAQRFTPRVSLAPPDGLLLEVKGSLGLFGGAAKLGAGFLVECRAAGSRPRLALAPTSLAALAGARSGKRFNVAESARLVGALAPLPLEALRWPPEVLERLAKAGVRTIGAALRLPRAGLARRFGAEALASLDRLVGRAADLRRTFRAPERFRVRRACAYELERHEALLAALAPLLESLGKFLEAHQCGITQLECRLWHRHAPPTQCVLRLAAPAADPRRLNALLGERLAALALPEPVRSCELRSGKLVPRELCADSLWQPGEHGGGVRRTESVDLIEFLRARLGVEAVHGLQVHPTHRPEAASRRVEIERVEAGRVEAGRVGAHTKWSSSSPAQSPPVPWAAFRRPLWLLPTPELLSERDGLPQHGGSLRLLGESERIETGWWEGGTTHAWCGQAGACPGPTCEAGLRSREVARDYYHAVDLRGVRLWIFREREKPHRWFLQGVFG